MAHYSEKVSMCMYILLRMWNTNVTICIIQIRKLTNTYKLVNKCLYQIQLQTVLTYMSYPAYSGRGLEKL